ncbi:MAG: hypothetical protein AAFX41_04525, partial [Bacteroidota bacterium]
MDKLLFSIVLVFSVTLWGCDSAEDPPDIPPEEVLPIELGTTASGITDENGAVLVTLPGNEEDYLLDVRLTDVDTEDAAPDIEVTAVALDGGIAVLTSSDDYFPYATYVAYSDFEDQVQSSAAPLSANSSVPVVTIAFGVVSLVGIGFSVYEFLFDPPSTEEIYGDDGTTKVCITGDLNDALAAFGIASGAASIAVVVRVLGAP